MKKAVVILLFMQSCLQISNALSDEITIVGPYFLKLDSAKHYQLCYSFNPDYHAYCLIGKNVVSYAVQDSLLFIKANDSNYYVLNMKTDSLGNYCRSFQDTIPSMNYNSSFISRMNPKFIAVEN